MVGALCLMYMASFSFLLCQLDSRVSNLVFFMDTECPVARLFFQSLAECSLGFTYVCVAAVDVTRDVRDGSILVFFRCFVFRVSYHRAEGVRRLVVRVYVM